ncbi:MAG: hypothetical protein PPP58_08780 [Natronomonas sp.]
MSSVDGPRPGRRSDRYTRLLEYAGIGLTLLLLAALVIAAVEFDEPAAALLPLALGAVFLFLLLGARR